jgi:hypothetical protein
MADGRLFTDYRPECYVNNLLRMSNNITSSYLYRQYLIHNASQLMNMNRQYANEKAGCKSCNAKEIPFYQKCDVNMVNTNCKINNANGIGTKFQSEL